MAYGDKNSSYGGYSDPLAEQEAYKTEQRGRGEAAGFQDLIDRGLLGPEYQQRMDEYMEQDFLRSKGWAPEQMGAEQAAYDARQRALGLDAGRAQQIAAARANILANRQAQAGLIGTMRDRAAMPGTSAAQWASRGGFNELAQEVAAQAAQDPRLAMRALAGGGQALAQQAGQAQAQEGMGLRGALGQQIAGVRGADLQQAGRENQLIADAIRWQNAKEMAAQRWSDVALRNRGQDLGLEAEILRAQAGAEGGINWQNIGAGVLGAAGAGLASYGSMPKRQVPAGVPAGVGQATGAAGSPGGLASPMGQGAILGAQKVLRGY
jgi:hypothetical protein